MDGVAAVMPEKRVLAPVLLSKSWMLSTDVSVFLPLGASAAERDAVRARLAAIDGVAKVTWESPEEGYRVTLDGPARVGEFHLALCGSRKTGECAGGLAVLEHPRKSAS